MPEWAGALSESGGLMIGARVRELLISAHQTSHKNYGDFDQYLTKAKTLARELYGVKHTLFVFCSVFLMSIKLLYVFIVDG